MLLVLSLWAAVIAKPQPPGLQHLLAYGGGGSGSVPSKYPGSEDKNRREMGGDFFGGNAALSAAV